MPWAIAFAPVVLADVPSAIELFPAADASPTAIALSPPADELLPIATAPRLPAVAELPIAVPLDDRA